MAQLRRLQITLPTTDGTNQYAARLERRPVIFARLPDGRWRSVEPVFAAQVHAPHARTIYHRALVLVNVIAGHDGVVADAPREPIYRRPVTDLGTRLRHLVSAHGQISSEIEVLIENQPARLFGWASDWPTTAAPENNDVVLPDALFASGNCRDCGRAIGPDELPQQRCSACLAATGAMPPVVARALSLVAADRPLLFWDTETDGLIELDLELNIRNRVPHIWDLGWLASSAATPTHGVASRMIMRGPALSRRLSRLSGVPAETPLHGEDNELVLRRFAGISAGRVLIGHNGALYDEPVLRGAYASVGLPVPESLDTPSGTFDTLPLARILLPKGAPGSPERHQLGVLVAHFGLPMVAGFHTAAADAASTAGIFGALTELAIERYGGREAAFRLAAATDRSDISASDLYGWKRHDCQQCGRSTWSNPEWKGLLCDSCHEAAKPYRAECAGCGETIALRWAPRPGWQCRVCRAADQRDRLAAAVAA